ncbi:hypothetical protein BU17DRAFT_46306 [Hysterangium stoloniferum]|nr:hypothetical protein BU17DRAFT_46306 [Hysterangium stoloniferum]
MDDPSSQLIYAPNILHNSSIDTTKFLVSCVVGAAAGILGLEHWQGFVFFAASSLGTSLLIAGLKCGGKPEKYMKGGWAELVMPDTASFVLIWTLFCELNTVFMLIFDT